MDTELALIEAAKRDDRRAQSKLYERYAQAMLNVAYRVVWNEEDARDVLQDAFLKIFSRLNQLKDTATFAAWTKRIVLNTAINHNRKNGKLIFTELTEREVAVANEHNESTTEFTIAQMKRCLLQLPKGYRTVLSLYLIEGYDHKEIASILGISQSTSITQYNRGKKRLRSLMSGASCRS